ncbi:MAG: metallophosphoesterase [Clostridia bacterium]|nr:metallophosphoesterase [Clostridia bacterium]
MIKLNTVLDLGLEKEVKFIHVSDTHIFECDERDNERKNTLPGKRAKFFPQALENYQEILDVAKETNLPVMHTGDLIDFVSIKNLDLAKNFANSCDLFMASGNHEFSQYVGEAWEDAEYRNQSLDKVQACFNNNIRFDSKVINGVNFVVIDNSYYLYDEEQYIALKKEAEKQLPIILLMHCPLHEQNLYDIMMSKSDCAYLVGTPENLLKRYDEKRQRQQKPDDITLKTIDFINNCQLIKAMFVGHNHFDYEGMFNNIPFYVTGKETIRFVTIK